MDTLPTAVPLGLSPRLVRASWATVGVLTVASLAGVAAAPLLLVKAPLLLAALAPDGRHIALMAGQVDPWLLAGVTLVRRSLYSFAVYGLGFAYGDFAVKWIEARARRLGSALRALERLFARVGAVLLLPLPLLSLCVLAGAARTRFAYFTPAILLGHCIWIGTTVWLGARFSAASQVVIDFFSERLLESTLVCIALVAVQQVLSRRKPKPS